MSTLRRRAEEAARALGKEITMGCGCGANHDPFDVYDQEMVSALEAFAKAFAERALGVFQAPHGWGTGGAYEDAIKQALRDAEEEGE
jgi:hypothetical protein